MLFGREPELGALRAALDQAREGVGHAVVVHGGAGIGKSALLEVAAHEAAGFRVLRTRGVESESPLAFGALHRLMLPLLDRLDRLPAPQAQAMAAVLGRHAGPGGDDRFLVFLAALGLVSDAAEESPVLCVIDDAHWLDEASQAALLFVARRVDVTAAVMLFAARDGDARSFEAPDLVDLPLRGLDAAASASLLEGAEVGHELSPSVRDGLVERVGGNPLAMLEIARALSPTQAEGTSPLPRELPLTNDLERVFLGQVDRLDADARRVLLLAALDDTGAVGTVRRAASSLGLDPDAALGAAEEAGLVSSSGDGLAFRHPLLRSAIATAAPVSERRRAHAALAEALDAVADPDRAVWHRAASVDPPDEATAERLDRTAARARRIGGHEASSAAWERAAELSAEVESRATRLAEAGASAWAAGDPGRARFLAERVLAVSEAPGLVAEADRLRAFIEMNFGSPRLAHGILVRAARDADGAGDRATARRLAMIAAAIATFDAHSGAEVDVAALAADPDASAEPADACLSALLTGMDHLAHERYVAAAADLRRGFELAEPLRVPDLVTNIGIAALQLGDDRAALRWHDRQLDDARESAAVLQTIHALTRRGVAQLTSGEWGELRAAAAEVLDLARAVGQPNQRPLPLAQLLVLDAHRGDADVPGRADEIEAELRRHPAGVVDVLTLDLVAWARGVGAARTAPESALAQLASITLGFVQRAAALDLMDAAARAERTDLVEATVGHLAQFGDATGEAWALGDAAYGRALLAPDDSREAEWIAALRHHEAGTRPLDRARAQLAYGEFLRRARRRVDAREHLRSAIATFDRLGATAWADRATEELRASGETARRRSGDDDAGALTAQELQVARLVKSGLSNREVAARLFVSPRTVEFHLRNVFAKLGISSRGGLVAADLEPAG